MTVLMVDGKKIYVELDPRKPLLEVLHTRLELIGTKKGCDQGQCGAHAIHFDGRRVVSCLTIAWS
jgi:xanthine dehydrogenase YagT iron-sulfur-binding subunit